MADNPNSVREKLKEYIAQAKPIKETPIEIVKDERYEKHKKRWMEFFSYTSSDLEIDEDKKNLINSLVETSLKMPIIDGYDFGDSDITVSSLIKFTAPNTNTLGSTSAVTHQPASNFTVTQPKFPTSVATWGY